MSVASTPSGLDDGPELREGAHGPIAELGHITVQLRTDLSPLLPDEAAMIAARGDHMSDSLIETPVQEAMAGTSRTRQEFIDELIRRGHYGPFEHPKAVFVVEGISRVVMAQITRHRHASFDVQSVRYTDFSDKSPVVPAGIAAADGVIGRVATGAMERAFDAYRWLVDHGLDSELARYALPLSTPVNMTFSANPRTLMHVLDLRLNAKAQGETAQFSKCVSELFHHWAPKTADGYQRLTQTNSLRAP